MTEGVSATSGIGAEFNKRRPEENGAGISVPAAPDLSASFALSGTEDPTSKIARADVDSIPQKLAFGGPSPEPQFGGLGVTGADGMQPAKRPFETMG